MNKTHWNQIQAQSAAKPNARWGQSTCLIDDEFIIFGGYADNTYMNDLWSLNVLTFKWTLVNQLGIVPESRSNATMNYDKVNGRILLFGGGGNGKKRFNTVHSLNWSTKEWTELQPVENNGNVPWERTYHNSQLLGKYLIIFGGQNFADLDDLWVFDTENNVWKQIQNFQTMVKPCARRFHTSILKDTKMYIIGGCKQKYRCLSDLYEIDLKNLIQSDQNWTFEWKKIEVEGSNIISRWGHTSTYNSNNNKIYVFGGRFSDDLNDLLSIDLTKMTVDLIKVQKEPVPKPRRRHSAQLIGNHLLIFGGFNGAYYNDLHSIKIQKTSAQSTSKKPTLINVQVLTKKDLKCLYVIAQDNQSYFLNSLILEYFQSQIKFQIFKQLVNKNLNKQELQLLFTSIIKGYNIINRSNEKSLTQTKRAQKIQQIIKQINKNRITKNQIYSSQDLKLAQSKNMIKSIMNISKLKKADSGLFAQSQQTSLKICNEYMKLNDEDYDEFVSHFRTIDGLEGQDGQNQESGEYCITLKINYIRLSKKFRLFSRFFDNQMNFGKKQIFYCHQHVENTYHLFQIVINYLKTSIIVHPEHFGVNQWTSLYMAADYLMVNQLKFKLQKKITQSVNAQNLSLISSFASEMKLEKLLNKCCQILIKTSITPKTAQNNTKKLFAQKKQYSQDFGTQISKIKQEAFQMSKGYKFNQKCTHRLSQYFQINKYDFNWQFMQDLKELTKKNSKNSQNEQKQNEQNNYYQSLF